jgi:RHS repeat-associated protein
METDNEAKGNGNSYTTEFRQYDPRLGRWLSLDPLMKQFPWMSPYVAFDNNPIFYTDPLGLASEGAGDKKKKEPRAGSENGQGGFNGSQNIPEMKATPHKTLDSEKYYARSSGKWEERGMMYTDAVKGDKANYLNALIANNNRITSELEQQTKAMLERGREERKYYADLAHKVKYQNNPFYLLHETMPTGSIDDVSGLIKDGSYWSAGGLAVLELLPGELDDAYKSFKAFKKVNGAAGEGRAWHHIVEQNPTNKLQFAPELLHNSRNLLNVPHGKGSIHMKVSGYYSSKQSFTGGQTVRQWVSSKSYEDQYSFGLQILEQFGWK